VLGLPQKDASTERSADRSAVVRCRQIEQADVDSIVTLLASAFGDPNPPLWRRLSDAAQKLFNRSEDRTVQSSQRAREFWQGALRRMGSLPIPSGYPTYGYILTADCLPVGILLLIVSRTVLKGEPGVRCNLSSWYVDPRYRAYAPLLVSRALSNGQMTYYNVTPSPNTWAILDAQGFRRFCAGTYICVPLLSRSRPGEVVRATAGRVPGDGLTAFEVELLHDHAAWGCLSFVGHGEEGRYPFVFSVLRWRGCIKYAYLIYSSSLDDFARFAAPLGQALARHGVFLVALGSDGPVKGLVGVYVPNRPKFFKGPHRLRLGDLAYSERAIFGL
jgi:hypothetical protein